MRPRLSLKECRNLLFYSVVVLVFYSIQKGIFFMFERGPSNGSKNFSLVNQQRIRKEVVKFNKEKIQVLALSYQRSGSSFMGEMFNQNTDAFYWFEPGDAIYSNIYNTEFGWNVPSDIFHFNNGTRRSPLPKYEINAVADTLRKIYMCDFKNVPVDLLIHPFFGMFYPQQIYLQSYYNCISKKVNPLRKHCQSDFHEKICPRRFQPHKSELHLCTKEPIWNTTANAKNPKRKGVVMYRNCMDALKIHTNKCIKKLYTPCRKADIVSMKTVRVTMETVKELLQRLPNLYVVHYIRDPRGMVVSRKKQSGSFVSLYSKYDINKEAQVSCDQILQDVKLSKELEKQYPSRLLRIYYGDLAGNTNRTLHEIYNFIRKPLPYHVLKWFTEHTQTKINATKKASKWMKELTYDRVLQVNRECEALYKELDYPWSRYM